MSIVCKIIKYVAIVFSIVLILAIVIGIASVCGLMVSSSDEGLNIDKFSDEESILSIATASCEIVVKDGKDFKVETDNKYITSKQTDNKLAIKEKNHRFSKNSKEKVIVYIPEDITFDKVYISNGAGKITIENIICEDLDFDIGVGKVEIENLTVFKNTNIDGGVGTVKINNADFNNLDLDVGVGEFSITGVLDGKTKIDAGVGALKINLLDDKDNYSICAEKGIGSINIDGKTVKDKTTYGKGKNKIDIDGGIGSINVKFEK